MSPSTSGRSSRSRHWSATKPSLAQERLHSKAQFPKRNTKKPTLLQGILVCRGCGYACTAPRPEPPTSGSTITAASALTATATSAGAFATTARSALTSSRGSSGTRSAGFGPASRVVWEGPGEPGLSPIRCGGRGNPGPVGHAARSPDASRRPYRPTDTSTAAGSGLRPAANARRTLTTGGASSQLSSGPVSKRSRVPGAEVHADADDVGSEVCNRPEASVPRRAAALLVVRQSERGARLLQGVMQQRAVIAL